MKPWFRRPILAAAGRIWSYFSITIVRLTHVSEPALSQTYRRWQFRTPNSVCLHVKLTETVHLNFVLVTESFEFIRRQ